MRYTRLGRTGLRVSRIGLGRMSYGDAGAGLHRWTLGEDDAAAFFRQAVESGITFWDTANVYQGGSSEEFAGRAIARFSRREDIVLATKVSGKMHDGPGGSGLSRKAILEQADASLRRLGVLADGPGRAGLAAGQAGGLVPPRTTTGGDASAAVWTGGRTIRAGTPAEDLTWTCPVDRRSPLALCTSRSA
ncbi:aldo/keto reductase [Actinoplanes sp. CA-054009]